MLLPMGASARQHAAAAAAAAPDPAVISQRAQVLLRDANGDWTKLFAALGSHYPPPALAFFTRTVPKACGAATALAGPFYCPDERKVYLDLAFLGQLAPRGSSTVDDAAIAYVLGHEIGHHVQSLLGTTALVEQARARSTPAVSARTWMTAELQADCYAGIWLGSALKRGVLPAGTNLAAVIAAIAPVSEAERAQPPEHAQMADPLLTYGTAAQRQHWLQQGIEAGQVNGCDTFGAEAAGKL